MAYATSRTHGAAPIVKYELFGNVNLHLLNIGAFGYRALATRNREFLFETENYQDQDLCWKEAIRIMRGILANE